MNYLMNKLGSDVDAAQLACCIQNVIVDMLLMSE